MAALQYFISWIQGWQGQFAVLAFIITVLVAIVRHSFGIIIVGVILIAILFSAVNLIGGMPQG